MDILDQFLAPLAEWVAPWLSWFACLWAVVACVVHRKLSPRMWVLGLGFAGMLLDGGWLQALARLGGEDPPGGWHDRSILVDGIALLARSDALALIAFGLAFVFADLRHALAASEAAATPGPGARSFFPAAVLVAVLAGESLAALSLSGLPSLVEELNTTDLPWATKVLGLACLAVCVRHRRLSPRMGTLVLGFAVLAALDFGLPVAARLLGERDLGGGRGAGLAGAVAAVVGAFGTIQVARGLSLVFSDVREVLSEGVVVPPSAGRLDLMAVVAGTLASGSATVFLTAVAGLAGWAGLGVLAVALLAGVASLAGGLFGGFFTAALAGRNEVRNALVAGVVLTIPSAALMLLRSAEFARLEGRDVWWELALFTLLWGVPLAAALVATFAVGAFAYRGLEGGLGASGPRQGWSYVTGSGATIPAWSPWEHPGLARFWTGASWLFWLGLWAPVYVAFTDRDLGILDAVVARLLPMARDVVAFAAMALACRALARRSAAMSAADAMSRDPRPPIVYLRSFADEGRKSGERFWRMVVTAPWQLLKETFEVRLDRAMRRLGPFVAIGRPGERLPALGASRMYVGDDHWQQVVDDLLQRGQFVVLQAGDSMGLQWEVRHVSEAVAPEKVLLFVPYALGRGRGLAQRERRYRAFRRWAGPLFPSGLPETLGDTFFIAFRPSPSWEPFTLTSARDVPADHPNRDLLARIADDAMFRRRHEFGWMFSLLILALAAIVIGWVISRFVAR